MSSINRARYVVELDGPWQLHADNLPAWRMLGTVQIGMRIGALAQSRAGIYAQIIRGSITVLDQRKAAAVVAAARQERRRTTAAASLRRPKP